MNSATNFYKPVLPVALNVKTSKTGTPAFRELTDCAGGQDRRKMGRKRDKKTMCWTRAEFRKKRDRAPEGAKPRWCVLVARAHCQRFRIQLPLGLALLWSSVLCVSEDLHSGVSLLLKSTASIWGKLQSRSAPVSP